MFSIMFPTGTQGFTDRNSSAELGGGVVQLVKFPGASAVSIRNHLPGRIWRSQNRRTGLFHTPKLPPSGSGLIFWSLDVFVVSAAACGGHLAHTDCIYVAV